MRSIATIVDRTATLLDPNIPLFRRFTAFCTDVFSLRGCIFVHIRLFTMSVAVMQYLDEKV